MSDGPARRLFGIWLYVTLPLVVASVMGMAIKVTIMGYGHPVYNGWLQFVFGAAILALIGLCIIWLLVCKEDWGK